jgi:hypothetical protein
MVVPASKNCWAMVRVPSPPAAMSAEMPRSCIDFWAVAIRSAGRRPVSPWPVLAEKRPLLAAPRIVPPQVRMPRVDSVVSGIRSPGGSRPSKPRRTPATSQPRRAEALTTARITALRPGQSPPPVRMPIFFLIFLIVSHDQAGWTWRESVAIMGARKTRGKA